MPMTIGSDNKAVLDYSLTCADVDGHSQARLSCYENLVQEAAAMHATMKGMGIYDLQRENRTWVIARSRMTVSRYVRWPGDHIRVTTWPQESTGFNCPRHIEAEDASGRRLFECETKWAVIDFRTGRPMRAMDISSVLGLPAKEEQGESRLPNLTQEDAEHQSVLLRSCPTVHYLDTDLNRHVNNMSYINWCLDALPDSFRDEYKPVLVDVRWIKQCFRHDNLTVIVRSREADGLKQEEPSLWFDIMRTEDSGASTKVFDALIQWKRRNLVCDDQ